MGTFTTLALACIAICTGVWLRSLAKDNHILVSDNVQVEYDYIVVGAGSAGSVLAARLAEDRDNNILLLEAGGHFDEDPTFHIPALWGTLIRTKYDWEYYTEKQTDIFQSYKTRQCNWPRGRVVGGSSVLNAMVYTRGSRFDYDQWETDGCKGWDYKSVLPYFLKSENILIDELKSSPYHSRGGPLAVSHNKPTQMTNAVLGAGKELGYDIIDYNGASQEGFGNLQATIRDGIRSSTGLEFIGRSKETNLDISIYSLVTKVEIEQGKAVGVYFIKTGQKHFVKARKEIIISAGSINSPQLLMLSGIGPKSYLEDVGIPVKMDLPVGKYLKDHQAVLLPARTNDAIGSTLKDCLNPVNTFLYDYFKTGPLASSLGEIVAFFKTGNNTQNKSPNIQMIFASLLSYDFIGLDEDAAKTIFEQDISQHGISTWVCLLHPKSVGSLRLRSSDPFDHPVINPGYFSNQDDIKTMIDGIRIWEKLTQTKTFQEIGVDIKQLKSNMCSKHEFLSDAYWECFIRQTAYTFSHHTSSCRMGPDDDPLAVVDPNLKVRGIQNLRVVDASVFPDVTSGNTNAPTIMVAEKAADMIRGMDTVKEFKNINSI